MSRFRLCVARAAFATIAFVAVNVTGSQAEDYPSRPVRLVVASPAGGGTDIIARHVAQRLSARLPQAFVVENRPGAGSLVGTDFVAKAPPDGHTLMMGGLFNIVMNSALIKNLPYDPLKDFVVADYISAYPFILLARKDLPVSTLAEFAAYAKARPGQLNYASAGLGTLQHVWGTILLKSMGLDMQHIPYRGAAAAQQDMIGGRVDVLFDNLSSAKVLVQSGQLKALGVSSASRAKAVPEVPTINETGVVKFEGESWFGVFAPSGTPQAALDVLRREIAAVKADPAFAAAVERDTGRILSIPAAERASWLQGEISRWVALVDKYGVPVQ